MLALLTMAAWFPLVAAQTPAQPQGPPGLPQQPPARLPQGPTGLPQMPPATLPGGPAAVEEDVQPTPEDDKDTIEAGAKWLALLDEGKLGTAWDVSSAYLKSVVSRKKWVTEIGKARKPLGKLATRKVGRFARAHSLPGAPEGDYSIVEFDSTFANDKHATEQVIWMFENKSKSWRVSGYFIR
jgi:hypothetical protein